MLVGHPFDTVKVISQKVDSRLAYSPRLILTWPAGYAYEVCLRAYARLASSQ